MKSIFLILIATIFSFAINIPSKTYTTITSVNGNRVTLSEPLPINGMSALVVRSTSSGEYALVFIKQTSKANAVIIDKDPVGGKNLAKLKPIPKVGDRVIGGFNYDKALILAPNNRYNQIVSQLGVKAINPELYMAYKANGGSSSYNDFAKVAGIGLVIVTNGNTLEVIDAISQETILKESIK
jgi:hypothetical protein